MQRYEITGMSCAACASHVEKAVAAGFAAGPMSGAKGGPRLKATACLRKLIMHFLLCLFNTSNTILFLKDSIERK